MKEKEIEALISLLDDPDTEVVNEVTDNLTKKGLDVIPQLEKAWESTFDEVLQLRLENVIQHIQLYFTKENLKKWVRTGAENILEGAFYIARYQYPDINISSINKEIDKIRKDVWLEINNNLTAFEKIKILNYVMFDMYNYSNNKANVNSPHNSYINQVIKTKKGNPITLSIIYLSVANKLNLPVFGVCFSESFLLAYRDEHGIYHSGDEYKNILFYINPNDNCTILDNHEADYLISEPIIEKEGTYLTTCSNIDILILLVNDLIYSYEKSGLNEIAENYQELLKILKQD